MNVQSPVESGIEAPNDIPVHRKEIYDAIKRNAQAGEEEVVA